MFVRRSDRIDPEAARIEGPAEAANDAALAGGIRTLENDDCALGGSEIRLLYELKHSLKRGQAALVINEVHLGVFGNRAKPRTERDLEAPRTHRAVERQIS
jgi:hypothetical protein